MSLATAKTQPLTTISGGINRLRSKGGATRDALFDAVNCYVTAANTVVPRPGTNRNADLSALAPAGATKGLVGYQGQLHVFSASVVTVPAGYVLHVLNHPAAQQIGNNTTFSMTANHNFLAPTNIGYGASPTFGSLTPTTLLGADGNTYTVATMINYGVNNNDFLLQLSYTGADPAQTAVFAQVSFTDQNGHAHTFLSSSVVAFSANGGLASWEWAQPNGAMFANAGVYPITIGQAVTVPIPIKEIHFASPFFGGLYVVAEFSPNSSVSTKFGTTFHFYIQSSTDSANSTTWTPNTDVQIGQVMTPTAPNGFTYVASRRYTPNPTWTPNTAVNAASSGVAASVVEPTIPNGKQYTVTATLGVNPTTSSTEPTWPLTDGLTVQENSALQNDQTVTIATASPAVPVAPTPPKYQGTMI